MRKETYEKLVEAVCFIENTAQNMQTEDSIITNEWDTIEADARDLRELIEALDYEDEELKDEKEETPEKEIRDLLRGSQE